MPNFPPILAWTRDREPCVATYSAEWKTIGNHEVRTVTSSGEYWEKPQDASHVVIQANRAIRYTFDETAATRAVGFRAAANVLAIVPCPNRHVSVCSDGFLSATVQRQWVR